jgi:hypothetical protein
MVIYLFCCSRSFRAKAATVVLRLTIIAGLLVSVVRNVLPVRVLSVIGSSHSNCKLPR